MAGAVRVWRCGPARGGPLGTWFFPRYLKEFNKTNVLRKKKAHALDAKAYTFCLRTTQYKKMLKKVLSFTRTKLAPLRAAPHCQDKSD